MALTSFPVPTTPAALVDVENLRSRVEGALTAHRASLASEIAGVSAAAEGAATALTDQASVLLSGGKRLRAALCWWSYRAHGGAAAGPAAEAVVGTGAALELFQAAALLHDDVMDNSDTRRGSPTAHRSFAARHAGSGWSGDSVRFGEAGAILLGDLVLIAAQRELTAALARVPQVAPEVREAFDRMQTEVVTGQYLDVLVQAEPWGADPVADESRARAVLRAKSAGYSVASPLELGALLAGAGRERATLVHTAGVPLGEAFQLRDDVLGVFGDPAVTGKPAGDDLREGKRTVLVARAMAGLPSGAGRDLLVNALGDPGLSDDAVRRVREVIVESGALSAVELLVTELYETSTGRLDAADLTAPGREMLAAIARALVDREA
ncbi:polyprenyl synthetase family protein [Myceligenerans xiligouense]|uniref:Geranylgeranyl diphosphate synthase type I n=1 Tax=Myceligenerans xiligouense TaxID=253184 RepID=A0A3N4Z6E5_9MICO|nr:polyprenyl synthetase family protein [Myceligenerans xiligouense]RPF20852.1 geranylgeranyl diphosphate synthase type I [Myceligenerans xiligouense]